MSSIEQPRRNEPAEEGRKNDPDLRDRSGVQPGTSTISKSETDEDNQELTKTGADNFRTDTEKDPNADPAFDEVDKS
ncbi:MAG: hypothetical protein ACJ75B_10065 [Flavisolibacter sp.]